MHAPQALQNLINVTDHAENNDVGVVMVQVKSRVSRLDVQQERVELAVRVVEVVDDGLALRRVQITA